MATIELSRPLGELMSPAVLTSYHVKRKRDAVAEASNAKGDDLPALQQRESTADWLKWTRFLAIHRLR